MKALKFILPVTASLLIATNVVALDVKDKLTDKISSFKDGTMNAFSGQLSESISSFAQENFESMKYLDFSLDLQQKEKPTFSIMSVNEIMKIDSGTIFNQTSLNNYDSDQTLNIGFGSRKLLNNNTLMLGANTFFDHQFSENHQRVGAGVEAITSIFDVRANYYNALSGRKTNDSGTIEKAMDGWDLRADYHLPIEQDVNIFVSAFEFENPESASSYKETGNKYGADAKLGNFLLEGGYQDDNQANDYWFGNITYVVNFGSGDKDTSSNSKLLTDVSDQLYQPVKRENKIRVVKIDASGVVVGGF